MGSIENNEEQTVVTFEIERLLDEPVRMMDEGILKVAKNITIRHVIGWVLWSLLGHKAPAIDLTKIQSMDVAYKKEEGTVTATMKKQP
jgi:hypothetical protein